MPKLTDKSLLFLAAEQIPGVQLAIFDLDARCRVVAGDGAPIFGRTTEAVGHRFETLFPEVNQRPELNLALSRAQQGHTQRISLEREDRVLHLELGPLRAEGAVVAVYLVPARAPKVDRKTVSERLQSLATLAAGVGHEVNNPLTYLFANLEALRGELEARPEMTRARELFDEAWVGAERMRVMVKSLRSFADRASGSTSRTSLHRIVEWAVQLAAAEVEGHATLEVESGEPCFAEIHEGLFMELLIHLIFDVAEALPSLAAPHRVRLTVSANPEGSTIRLEAPVPFRAPLDLNVATSLAQRLGLRLVPHESSLELLVGRRTEERTGRRPTPPPRNFSLPPAPPKKKPAVLVIDDDPRVGAALRRLLSHDAEVTVLSSAADALETLKAGRRYGLILCDLMMPGMTGMQFHEALQESLPEIVERVAYMTGGAFSQGARQFLERVKNTHLEKPVDVETLRNLVKQAAPSEP